MLRKNHPESLEYLDTSSIARRCAGVGARNGAATKNEAFTNEDEDEKGKRKLPRFSNTVDRCLFMSNQMNSKDKELFTRSGRAVKMNFKELAKTLVISPDSYELPYEFVQIKTKDGENLVAYLVKQPGPHSNKIPTIILFHGNAGNIGHSLPVVSVLFEEMKCNIFAVEYRGFGFSSGVPTERGVYLDAQTAFDYVVNRLDLDSTKIIIHGFSIGGSVAIDLASREKYRGKIAALIVENTFACLSALVKELTYGAMWLRPLNKLIRSMCQLSKKFPNYQKMSLVECPVLFLSALKDRLIHPHHMTALFKVCKARKHIAHFEGAHHIDLYTFDEYTREINTFVQNVFSLQDPQRNMNQTNVNGTVMHDPSFLTFLEFLTSKKNQNEDAGAKKKRHKSRITFGVGNSDTNLNQAQNVSWAGNENNIIESASAPGPSHLNHPKTIIFSSPFTINHMTVEMELQKIYKKENQQGDTKSKDSSKGF